MYPDRDMTTAPQPPVELVTVPEMPLIGGGVRDHVRDHIFIDVIHDGHWIPEAFMTDGRGRELTLDELQAYFVRERDWGAGLVASRIASRIGLKSFARVNVSAANWLRSSAERIWPNLPAMLATHTTCGFSPVAR